MTSSLSTPSRTRARRSRLLLVSLPLLVTFAVGEVWVRAYKNPIDLLAINGTRPGLNPMSSWAVVDAFSAYRGRPGFSKPALGKSINSEGFISTPELTRAKPDGTLRVAFLGGSFLAGQGSHLPDVETWPWLVAAALRAARPDQPIEFINAALGGYSSFETLGSLWARLRFYEPDVLVFCQGWNEFYYWNARYMDEPTNWRRLEDGGWALDRWKPPFSVLSPWPIDGLIQWSQLLSRTRLHFSPRLGGEAGGGADADDGRALLDHYDQRGADVWRTNLKLVAATAELMGAELFVAKQPTLIVPDLPDALRERCMYGHHGFDHDAHVAAFSHLYQIIDEVVVPERVIDLTPLSGRGDLFTDHVHPSVAGVEAIAEIVADALLSRSEVLVPK